jgi:predicted kinase
MERYANLSGESGVEAFEILTDSIHIRFRSGETYVYSARTPGPRALKRMKALARAGRGLSTYIAREVKDRYESKL